MLIPVYIVGFIVGGLVLFAIAQRIPNRIAKIWLRTIGVLAGPVFFLAMAIFSSWERERTYEMEWLIGGPAVKYLRIKKYDNYTDNFPVTSPVARKQEDLVVLKRNIGNNRECYSGFASDALAHYLEGLPAGRVEVRYRLIYDFYLPRSYMLESIGDFGRPHGGIEDGLTVDGKRDFQNALRSCFSWEVLPT
jgi:hypothetical protein